MHLTPRELDKLLIYMMAEVAREGKSLEQVMKEARSTLTRNDVMEGVAEMIPLVQLEAVFTDGSRLVTVHGPIQ